MIVVTGGTGLVGSYLLLELLKENKSIRVIIREDSNPKKVFSVWNHYIQNPDVLLKKIDWYRCDITDKALLSEALQGADRVYHCAAQVSIGGLKKRDMFEVNVLGTRNVVDICIQQNVKKLLHVSSIAAIGKAMNESILTETDGWPVKSKSIYAQTKTLAELEVWRGIAEGLNAVIINPSVILGPGDWQQSSSRLFDLVFKGLKYYTKGSTGFVDVHDVVKAMLRLMNGEIAGERFILNSENLTYEELFIKIANALGIKAPAKYASPFMTSLGWRAELIRSFLTGKSPEFTRQTALTSHKKNSFSSDKIKRQLDYNFIPVEQSIIEIANMYLNQKDKAAN
jgi:nucleoside-diphosphate-sugar epimerase